MKIFITLIFLFQFSCLCSDEIEWTNINDINFEECFSDTEGHYIFNVESYNLKNDCTLIIRPIYKCKNESQLIYTQVYLEVNHKILLILNNKDGVERFNDAKKYLFRYEGVDFENYFCLTRYAGAYYYYYLFDKQNGNFVMKFLRGSVDLKNNIIIFLDDSKNDEIILYDLMTQKKYKIDKYIKYGKYGSNTYWENFKIIDVTEEKYFILFFGNYNENGDEIPQYFFIKK